MGIEKVIESYRKSLELVKDGIGEIDTESEHGKCVITEAQKVLGTLIEKPAKRAKDVRRNGRKI